MNKWTKEEVELLKIWCTLHWKYIDIANELNRTRNSIKGKCQQLKITNNLSCKRKTQEYYIKELKDKCPTVIVLDKYINDSTRIKHKCLICGIVHMCTPHSKINGNAHCNTRNNGGSLADSVPGITYLVYINKYDLYKIGITQKSTKERFRDNKLKPSEYEIILERYFDTGKECEKLEKEWLFNIKGYKVNTGLLYNGNNETFKCPV